MRKRVGDRRPVSLAKQHEQAIAQRGERVRRRSLRGMPGVFSQRHVPHIMQPILNRPMPAPQRFDQGRARFFRQHADQPIRHLAGAFPALEDHPFARINLDCGNFWKDGYKEVERCAPFAAATHIKTNMSTPDGKREPADWVKLFGILANAGYRGYVSIEMEPRDTDNPVLRYAPELIRCARMYSGA